MKASFVGGPPLVFPEDPNRLGDTTKPVWTILSGQKFPPPFGGSGSFVDIRDVSRLMVWPVDHPMQADGQRYIACAGKGSMQAIADILNKRYPERRGTIQVGEPGTGYLPDYSFAKDDISIDASKALEATGQDWIGYEQSVVDAAKAYERYL